MTLNIITTYHVRRPAGIVWEINFTRDRREASIHSVRTLYPESVNYDEIEDNRCRPIWDNENRIVALHIQTSTPETDEGWEHVYLVVSNQATIQEYRQED